MTGTSYPVGPWTPPYRVCDDCARTGPVRSDRFGACLLGSGEHGPIATCDRPDHFTRRDD